MEMQFTDSVITGLRPVLWEAASSEQTQEIRLTDGMPDVERVISTWGQSVLRSKEWNGSGIACSAGMMVWVLYAPEDGSAPRVVNTWLPFQLRWDLPEGTPEGTIRIQCQTRFADARSVSPRKILVRGGMSALAQAYVPEKYSIGNMENNDSRLELLHRRYPVRLRKEAGEKTFNMDEELTLPESAPKPESVIYWAMEPKQQDVRVLSDKLVFRGVGNLHILYRSQEGQLHSWDFSVPFSQYALLDETYGSDAQGDLCFAVTSLEPELAESGMIRLKCGLVGQYVVTDREMLDVVEDAYSLGWELQMEQEAPEMSVLLDRRRENLYPELTLPVDADVAADVRFLPDFPQQRRESSAAVLQWPGTFQVLCYGPDGSLRSAAARWEGEQRVPLDSAADLFARPGMPEAQATVGSGTLSVTAEYPVELEAGTEQPVPMVTGIRTGAEKKPDGSRPSVILQRAGAESLWEMAKKNGSTMEAIRRANGIQEEPAGNQMLLIPVL